MTRILATWTLLAGVTLHLFANSALANEKCVTCHNDVTAAHKTSMHGKSGTDCSGCHGNVDAHLESPSKSNILSFGKNGSEIQNSQCLQCHGKNQKLMFWDNSKHKQEDVPCVSCHKVHKNTKPYAKQPENCFQCHRSVRADANKISHHPIIEEKIKCSDCHNPHGTLAHAMIKAETVNQLCYKCHSEKRGPFIAPHAPVDENCLNCHAPHGTKAYKLTKEKVPNLCQNCHGDGSHHVSIYMNTTPKSAALGSRGCLNCHGSIHGTNAPMQQSFGR
jgi:DmsE family decaheme c-type cytochrome